MCTVYTKDRNIEFRIEKQVENWTESKGEKVKMCVVIEWNTCFFFVAFMKTCRNSATLYARWKNYRMKNVCSRL